MPAAMVRPQLPSRSPSTTVDDAPHDAAKSDEEAIDDVYAQCQQTGSLEAAARKLAEIAQAEQESGSFSAAAARRQTWWDDPAEAEFQAQGASGHGDDVEEEIEHLQEVVEGLWIGDLVAAMDTKGLEQRGITNILSLLRPPLKFSPQFATYSLEIDDAPTTDILTHLPSAVAWLQEALKKRKDGTTQQSMEKQNSDVDNTSTATPHPGGVLVHCQAGMSRSATVVAAYLMREKGIDPVAAVTRVREKRSVVDPSETFWHQLGLYYMADCKVTLRDRATRQFYMERTTSHIMNEGGRPTIEMMAKYPTTPTASNPPTPMGGQGRRKIRCKMCRRHLAVREHMMDHILDQSPVSRPRTPSFVSLPAPLSTRSSTQFEPEVENLRTRRPSFVSDILNPLTGLPGSLRSRRASLNANPESYGMDSDKPSHDVPPPRHRASISTPLEQFTLSYQTPLSTTKDEHIDAEQLTSPLPPHLLALRGAGLTSSTLSSPVVSSPPSSPEREAGMPPNVSTTSNANTARHRLSSLALTPAERTPGDRRLSQGSNPLVAGLMSGGAPILANPKCSGYFVEPLTWMEPVLASGDVSGKLVCPNERCKAKIGTFDWAGVQCGCKEWVTPGFCIHRSKVDEVW